MRQGMPLHLVRPQRMTVVKSVLQVVLVLVKMHNVNRQLASLDMDPKKALVHQTTVVSLVHLAITLLVLGVAVSRWNVLQDGLPMSLWRSMTRKRVKFVSQDTIVLERTEAVSLQHVFLVLPLLRGQMYRMGNVDCVLPDRIRLVDPINV